MFLVILERTFCVCGLQVNQLPNCNPLQMQGAVCATCTHVFVCSSVWRMTASCAVGALVPLGKEVWSALYGRGQYWSSYECVFWEVHWIKVAALSQYNKETRRKRYRAEQPSFTTPLYVAETASSVLAMLSIRLLCTHVTYFLDIHSCTSGGNGSWLRLTSGRASWKEWACNCRRLSYN